MLKYSWESDDRSCEGCLIRVPTSAEEFTKIAQLHINMQQKIKFLRMYVSETLVYDTRNIVGKYRTAFQTNISMIFYLNKFLPPNPRSLGNSPNVILRPITPS